MFSYLTSRLMFIETVTETAALIMQALSLGLIQRDHVGCFWIVEVCLKVSLCLKVVFAIFNK